MPAQPDADAFDYESALAACAGGDRDALRRIYQQEGGRMLAVALRIVRERTHAEDIVHDACLRIWQGAAGFDPARGSGRGWIYSVVRHLALNAMRDNAREQPADEAQAEALDAQQALQAHAGSDYAEGADLGRLQHCLERLEPARRDCILHAYVDGCTHGEIAARLGAPLGTVKAWIQRSLAALRECMA